MPLSRLSLDEIFEEALRSRKDARREINSLIEAGEKFTVRAWSSPYQYPLIINVTYIGPRILRGTFGIDDKIIYLQNKKVLPNSMKRIQ